MRCVKETPGRAWRPPGVLPQREPPIAGGALLPRTVNAGRGNNGKVFRRKRFRWMRGHPPSQSLRKPSAPPGAIRGGVTPAAPILSRGRHRHGPSAVRPAFGGRPKSCPPENFSVIPPAGAHRSSLRRPPCDGGRPLGRNARRAPGTSRRFLYTSHAGAPPAVVLLCSLLPLSAFQARTGVFSSVTGHRPLPGK